jgi:hypothetical protein
MGNVSLTVKQLKKEKEKVEKRLSALNQPSSGHDLNAVTMA